MASAGDGGLAAAESGALPAPPQPPFVEQDLVRQLTQWRDTVEKHLMEQAASYAGTKASVEKISDDNQRLDQRLDGVEATASARIDDIVARGVSTLQATIE